MTNDQPTTVSPPSFVFSLLLIGPTIAGVGVGFVIHPLTDWLADLVGSAPAVLRVLVNLPVLWLVIGLGIVGIVVGLWLVDTARKEMLRVTVADAYVEITVEDKDRRIARDAIHGIVCEDENLLLVDADEATIGRYSMKDISADELEKAFTQHGYPWRGADDPASTEFERWAEGDPALPDDVHQLFTKRARALDDGSKTAIANLTKDLRDQSIITRDRDGVQYYRVR